MINTNDNLSIFNCDKDSYMRSIWDNYKKEAIECAHHYNVIDVIINPFQQLKQLYSRCRKGLTSNFLMELYKIIQNGKIKPDIFIEKLFDNKVEHLIKGDLSQPWETLFVFRNIGKLYNMPDKCFPCDNELKASLKDPEVEKKLTERFLPVMQYVYILSILSRTSLIKLLIIEDINDSIKKLNCFVDLNKLKITKLAGVCRLYDIINVFVKKRENFTNTIEGLRLYIKKLNMGDQIQHLTKCLEEEDSLLFLSRLIDQNELIIQEVLQACERCIPDDLNIPRLRVLLRQIEPELLKNDMMLANEEIDKLESGELDYRESCWLTFILPVIQGEKEFDEKLMPEEYSLRMSKNLREGIYKLLPQEECSKTSVSSSDDNKSNISAEVVSDGFSLDSHSDNEKPNLISTLNKKLNHDKDVNCDHIITSLYKQDAPIQVVKSESHVEITAEDNTNVEVTVVNKSVNEKRDEPHKDNFTPQNSIFNDFSTLSDSSVFIPPDPSSLGGLLSGNGSKIQVNEETRDKFISIDGSKNNIEKSFKVTISAVAEGREGSKFPYYTQNLNEFINGLIESRDTCGLYWMSRLLGDDSPVPIWLAELFHLGIHYMPSAIMAGERIVKICTESVEKIDELDEENKIVLASALLRPALMKPDYAAMMTMISTLGSGGNSGVFRDSQMFDKILSIMRVGKCIDTDTLLNKDKNILEKQKEDLARETRTFLDVVRTGKLSYQPASKVKRNLFSQNGLIGRQIQLCLNNDFSEVKEFIKKYSDTRNIDILINSDRAIQHNTRGIEANSRRKLTDEISLAVDLLSQWDKYSGRTSSGVEEAHTWEKELLAIQSSMPTYRLKNSAAGRCLITQTNELAKLDLPNNTSEIISELELWPMRIPCICDSEEANSPVESLAWSISEGLHKDKGAVCSALILHSARGRLDTVKRFFECYEEYREFGDQFERAKDYLLQWAPSVAESMPSSPWAAYEQSLEYWKEKFDYCFENVKLEISDCYFRGAINYSQQGECNAECSSIQTHASEKDDKLSSIRKITEVSSKLKKFDNDKLNEVIQRINYITEQKKVERSVKEFLKIIEKKVLQDKVYSAAWDNIASAQEYMENNARRLPNISGQGIVDISAANIFYDELAKGPIKTIYAEKETLWNIPLKMRQSSDSKYIGKLTELLRVLRFNLAQNAKLEPRKKEGRPNFWDVIRLPMTLESPLPQWGSQSGGIHTIALGWNVNADSIDRLLRGDDIMPNEALTILCFNELGIEERTKLLRMSRDWPTFPIVIDTNLFNFISAREGGELSHALFQIALAGAPYNPYTPDVAGAVPSEMFYGREEDKKNILDFYGPSIIYGGRQLGKSALLHQIVSLDTPDFRVLLHTMERTETSLLNTVLCLCRDEGIVGPNTSSRTLRDKIGEWLNAKPGRRLLVLLDECDNALEEDAFSGVSGREFPDVMELRTIMEATERRFKVVFTGLHSVQRFSNTVNNPLYHFGTQICIGPLSTHDAYDLMTIPLSLLGMKFESQQLVQMALNHCNYQPKLIQMFCRELINAIEKHQSRKNKNECWQYLIKRDTVLKVYESQNLQQKIMECFKMTMDLDERYLVIGYAMCLHQDDGMTLSNLMDDLRAYWPAAFDTGVEARQNTQSLLHEMEGLGLVISLGGRYRLRTPNIVDLLGGLEHVVEELEQYCNKPWQQKADPDELRMEGAEIFVSTQYNLLADSCSRLIWISGLEALGLKRVPEALDHIAEMKPKGSTLRIKQIRAMSVPDAMKFVSQEYAKISEGGFIFWISSEEFPYMEEFMRQVDAWLNKLHTDRKFVKVVCLIDPKTLYEFILSGFADEFSSMQMLLRPWTLNSIDRRCREMTHRPELSPQEIMNQTGGWSNLVIKALSGDFVTLSDRTTLNDSLLQINASGVMTVLNIYQKLDESIIPEEMLMDDDGLSDVNTSTAVELLQDLYILRRRSEGLEIDKFFAQTLKEVLA